MVKSLTEKREALPKRPVRLNPLSSLSHPALDAPLVAGSWLLLFTTSFGGPVSWRILLSLYPAVWTIYLFDRIYDGAKHSGGPPQRKEFARKHPRFLKGLLMMAVVWAGGVGIFLPKEIWFEIAVIGLITIGYFLIFRLKTQSSYFPVKEMLIGFCFASGVGLPYSMPIDWAKGGALLVFGIMCTLNCLIISKSEADLDKDTDLSAWFSVPGRTFPFRSGFALCFILPPLLGLCGLPLILAGSLMISNLLLCLVYAVIPKSNGIEIQPFSDAALWIPGLVGCLIQLVIT